MRKVEDFARGQRSGLEPFGDEVARDCVESTVVLEVTLRLKFGVLSLRTQCIFM